MHLSREAHRCKNRSSAINPTKGSGSFIRRLRQEKSLCLISSVFYKELSPWVKKFYFCSGKGNKRNPRCKSIFNSQFSIFNSFPLARPKMKIDYSVRMYRMTNLFSAPVRPYTLPFSNVTCASSWCTTHRWDFRTDTLCHHRPSPMDSWLQKCGWVVTENPLHASFGVVADEICGCIPACLASAICSTSNNIRVFVFCFYSYCLKCYERSRHLVVPLGWTLQGDVFWSHVNSISG